MSADRVVLVIGATGPTGSHVVEQLTRAGVRVRAVTRDESRAQAMPALAGAEIVVADSSVPGSLAPAMQDVDAVYYVPPTVPEWDAMQEATVTLATDSGVRHFVKLSALGADLSEPSMSLSYHWMGEQNVERSGMAYTHIRPNSFFQNTLFDVVPISTESRFYSCVGDAVFAKVDTRDIGDVVVKVLTEPGHEGKTYELTGPQPLSYLDLAAELSAALGVSISYVDLSADEYEAHLVSAGFPDWMAREFATIYGRGFYRASGGSYTTSTVEDLLGRPPRSFAAFAREHVAAFRPH